MLLKMGHGLLTSTHTSGSIFHLATAQRGARRSPRCQSRHTGQGLSGSQQLLVYEILLFFFSEQFLLSRAGMLAGNDIVEKCFSEETEKPVV